MSRKVQRDPFDRIRSQVAQFRKSAVELGVKEIELKQLQRNNEQGNLSEGERKAGWRNVSRSSRSYEAKKRSLLVRERRIVKRIRNCKDELPIELGDELHVARCLAHVASRRVNRADQNFIISKHSKFIEKNPKFSEDFFHAFSKGSEAEVEKREFRNKYQFFNIESSGESLDQFKKVREKCVNSLENEYMNYVFGLIERGRLGTYGSLEGGAGDNARGSRKLLGVFLEHLRACFNRFKGPVVREMEVEAVVDRESSESLKWWDYFGDEDTEDYEDNENRLQFRRSPDEGAPDDLSEVDSVRLGSFDASYD